MPPARKFRRVGCIGKVGGGQHEQARKALCHAGFCDAICGRAKVALIADLVCIAAASPAASLATTTLSASRHLGAAAHSAAPTPSNVTKR
jgi:hypothetical protein